MRPQVLRRRGFEDDALAECLELGDGPLPLAIGVAPDEVVAAQVLVVAVVSERVPGNHEDRVPHGDQLGLAARVASPLKGTRPGSPSYSTTRAVLLTGRAADWFCSLVGRVVGA